MGAMTGQPVTLSEGLCVPPPLSWPPTFRPEWTYPVPIWTACWGIRESNRVTASLSKLQAVSLEATLHSCFLTQQVKRFVSRLQPPIPLSSPEHTQVGFPGHPENHPVEIPCHAHRAEILSRSLSLQTSGQRNLQAFRLSRRALGAGGPAEGRFPLSASDDGNIEASDCASASSSLHTR